MIIKNKWCDVCWEAVDWVGVIRDNKGELSTICRRCWAVLRAYKKKWQAEGLYSKQEKVSL